MLRTTCALLMMATFAATAADSPLVSLAKRTNRKAPKAKVITNETVSSSKGRVSVASETANPVPTISVQETPSIQVTVTSQTSAKPRPVVTEPTPPSSARSIDPASTARSLTPEITARPAVPSTVSRNVEPQSTSRAVPAASSAQNIAPQSTQAGQPPK